MIEAPYPHDAVQALSQGRPVVVRISNATCADLRGLVCRAACCYDWTIGLTMMESARWPDEAEANQVDPRGGGQMRLGADGYCVLSNPATRACMRYPMRPSVCSRAECALIGQSFSVTIERVTP